MEQVGDAGLGVLVLRAPEQGVERADLDADAAVHAERVVDVEAVERVDLAGLAALTAGRRLRLVALDVDAPVGALRAQSMQTVQFSSLRAMTPRARAAGASFSCGYCTVTAPLDGAGMSFERPVGEHRLASSRRR